MALTTEEAAYNTAVLAAVTALEDLIAAKSTGDVIQFTPVDIGDSAFGDNSHTNNDTAVDASLSQRIPYEVRGDGEFPIQVPAGRDGELIPLFMYVTNQAGDLS